MIKENNFTPKLKHKSNSEIQNLIENRKLYRKEAIQAAIWELELRGVVYELPNDLKEEIEAFNIKTSKILKQKINFPKNLAFPEIRVINFFIDSTIISLFVSLFFDKSDMSILLSLNIVVSIVYYSIFEYFFQRTPGKYITKTIVVTEEGNRPNIKNIFIRSLVRIIPLDGFSFLFGENNWGWHDKWSKTFVVKEADTQK